MSSIVTKPFDLLFKHTLSSDVAIKDFLKNHIPDYLYERIDLHSIQPANQSYVLSELQEFYSDLVFTCTIDAEQVLLYFLVEHQSKPNRLLPLRFMKYQIALLENFLQGKSEATPWPLLFCACFYHGAQSPYPYSTNIHDYFADPVLAKRIGTFLRFRMIDLPLLDNATMQRHGSLALVEKIFKHSSVSKDFYYLTPELLEENKALLDRSTENPLGPDYWHAVYLVVNRVFEQ